MFSVLTRRNLQELRNIATKSYASEDEANRAIVAYMDHVAAGIAATESDTLEANAAVRQAASIGFIDVPAEQPFVAPSLMQSEDEISAEEEAEQLAAVHDPSHAEALREILASVEEECYKVEMTPDGVFVVTYNAKVAVAACLDPSMADTLVNLLNSTRQTSAKNT